MQKKGKKVIVWVVVLAIVGALCYGGYLWWQNRQTGKQEQAKQPAAVQKARIEQGTIRNTVKATGSLGYAKHDKVSVPFAITPVEVLVKNGQRVEAGEALCKVDLPVLKKTIAELETAVAEAEAALSKLASQYKEKTTITAGIAGRVKAIHAKVGQTAEEASKQPEGLVTLSLDGRMRVHIDGDNLAPGAALTVVEGTTRYPATVDRITEGRAVVTFADTKVQEGAFVRVLKNREEIGAGVAEINQPHTVTTQVVGNITKVQVALNQQVTSRSTIMEVGQVAISLSYALEQDALANAKQLLADAEQVYAQGAVTAPFDGVVDSLAAEEYTETLADAPLLHLFQGNPDQMVVAVDELDVAKVHPGQTAFVAIDALAGKEIAAVVSDISHLGEYASGVTTYAVTLRLQDTQNLLSGMNGTATITVQSAENVLLVPLAALINQRGTQYVMLVDSSQAEEDASRPGVRVEVQTGLSDANYAEVVSGLSLGDEVLLPTQATPDANRPGTMRDNHGFRPDMMGQPGGGTNRRPGN